MCSGWGTVTHPDRVAAACQKADGPFQASDKAASSPDCMLCGSVPVQRHPAGENVGNLAPSFWHCPMPVCSGSCFGLGLPCRLRSATW